MLLAFCVACAEGTQNEQLSESTLSDGSDTPSNTTTAGTAGAAGTASAGGSGGMPLTSAGSAGMQPAGGSATAGVGGEVSSGGVAGGGVGGMGGAAGGGAPGMTSSGAAGMAGSGGSAATGFRYAKFVATSEQSGAVWSSCAELNLLTKNGEVISRSGWSVLADSQETDDEPAPATAALDGDMTTFWHSAWEPAPDDVNDAKLPHWLIINLGMPQDITGFSYLPRQTGTHGRIKDWEFYLSKDGQDWGTAVKKGTFPDGTAVQSVTF